MLLSQVHSFSLHFVAHVSFSFRFAPYTSLSFHSISLSFISPLPATAQHQPFPPLHFPTSFADHFTPRHPGSPGCQIVAFPLVGLFRASWHMLKNRAATALQCLYFSAYRFPRALATRCFFDRIYSVSINATF